MKTLFKNICIVAVFAVSGLNLPAQETFDLPGLVNKVLTENYQVRILKNEEQIAQNNNTAGNAGMLPEVGVEGQQSVGWNNTRQEFFNGESRVGDNAQSTRMDAFLNVNWTVFDGFRMFAQKDQLDILAQLGKLETRYFLEQTISDVTISYYELIKENKLLESYREALEVSRFRYRLEKKRQDVGSGNALLHNQALVDYNVDSIRVLDKKRMIRSLEIRINHIINRDPELTVIITDPEIVVDTLEEKETLITQSVESNKDIKRAHLEELIAETNYRIQKSDRYPTVDLFGEYSFVDQRNEVGFLMMNRSFGPQFGVRVRFNLYNGGNETREIRNAGIARQNTDLAAKDTKQLISGAVVDSYSQYESYSMQLALAEKNVVAAEKSLEIASQQLEKGAINGYDFRQTQLSVINAQNSATELRFALKALEVELNRLSGKLLEKYLN